MRCKITIFADITLIYMNNSNPQGRLPIMMICLCVLSIIAIAATSVYDLMLLLIHQYSPSQLHEMMSSMGQQVEKEQLDLVFSMADYSVYHLIFNVVELVGVILLLTRRSVGFHVYAAAQIGLCWVTAVGFQAAFQQTIFLSVIWVVAYYLAMRRMVGSENSDIQS